MMQTEQNRYDTFVNLCIEAVRYIPNPILKIVIVTSPNRAKQLSTVAGVEPSTAVIVLHILRVIQAKQDRYDTSL